MKLKRTKKLKKSNFTIMHINNRDYCFLGKSLLLLRLFF